MAHRIEREIKTVRLMIALYCHDHHVGHELCSECTELTDYALERLRKCVFQEGKTVCARCPVHCYRPGMRVKIREVMRYSGPRMTLRYPVLAIYHLLDRRRKEPIRNMLKDL
jgi:hypothetical protein